MRALALLLPVTLTATLTAAVCHNRPRVVDRANLEWDRGPKLYSTGSVGIPLSGFGVNATVDVLPAGPLPLTVAITKVLRNTGSVAVPAGYTVTDTVQAMSFVAVVGGSAGFLPVSGPPLAALTQPGPAIAPGDSATISFSFVVPGCGMYRETLAADGGGVVTESNETDNRVEHFFAVPGTQTLTITPVRNGKANIWHNADPARPSWTDPLPGLPFNAVTFNITAPAGVTFFYNYYQGVINGVHGAVARMMGPAPVQPPAAPVPGPVVINLQLQAVTAHRVPFVDILLDVGKEQLSGKVTAITADGCFMRQRQESFFVIHPGP